MHPRPNTNMGVSDIETVFYMTDSTKGQLTRFMSQICESFNPVGVSKDPVLVVNNARVVTLI